MSEDDAENDSVSQGIFSTTVNRQDKIRIPEPFREYVDANGETWWGYDRETGFNFLTDSYVDTERFETVNNRTYSIEEGSTVVIPKTSEELQGVIGEDRPDEDDPVYFFSSPSIREKTPMQVIVFSQFQFYEVLDLETLTESLGVEEVDIFISDEATEPLPPTSEGDELSIDEIDLEHIDAENDSDPNNN